MLAFDSKCLLLLVTVLLILVQILDELLDIWDRICSGVVPTRGLLVSSRCHGVIRDFCAALERRSRKGMMTNADLERSKGKESNFNRELSIEVEEVDNDTCHSTE